MNKKEKISVLISIVLISLLAIGAVSAADDVAVDDDLGLSAADEIQAVDDTQINDEIIQEPDIVEETQATEGDSPTTGDDTLRDEPTKTFSDLIADIGEDSSEVTLEGTYKYDPNEDNSYPIIRRDLTITGPATIDGNGLIRLFAVTGGATLTLKDLTFINGYADESLMDGAGIFAQGGNLVIQGCTFKNNIAYRVGGAIRLSGTSSLKVTDTVFESNKAGNENAGQAGAIMAPGATTVFEVENCTFIGCDSTMFGGAIFTTAPNSKITDCTFISNNAESANGGAVYIGGSGAVVSDSVFKENFAQTGGSGIFITGVPATVSNCIFDSNVAYSNPESGTGSEGAIFLSGAFDTIISKCIFVNNSALMGAAIGSMGSDYAFDNCIFLDNIATAKDLDWAVKATDIFEFDPDQVTITANKNWFGSTVDNYTAELQTFNETFWQWQGIANVQIGNWYFLNLTETEGASYYDILISLNNLYDNATGEVSQDANYNLPDLNVTVSATAGELTPTTAALENGIANVQYDLMYAQGPATVTADVSGIKVSKQLQGIIVPGSYTELQSLIDAAEEGATIVLDHNIVYDANYDGADFLGGMSVTKSVTIIGAEGIEISGNHLARIFKVTNNAVLTLKDLTLCEGNADSNRLDAGAIIASNGNLDIQGCTFRHNIAYQYGGDIRSAGGYLKVKDSTFASSRANSYAGSIFAQGTGLELTNCTFFDCNSNNAGVIYTAVPNAEISGCTFKNNRASSVAAAIMAQGGPLTIRDTVFEANTAGVQSTVVATAATRVFDVINCTFTDNIANGGVGTIDTQCPNTKIIDSKFTGSSCGAYGGAIRLRGANSVVRNTIFENNHAGYNGGAIYLNAAATNSRIENCTFKGNTAGQGGSAIYIVDADATVSNCIFDSNSVPSGSESGYQGTVYLTVSQYPGRTVAFSNCIFVNNSAFRGSAITSFYAGFTVENSIFLDNIATDQVNTLGAEARDIFFIPNPDSSNSPIVRNNWFGSTVDNYTDLITFNITTDSYQGVTNVNMSSWYFLDLAATAGESYYDLLISLNNLYTPDTEEVTQDANYNLPDLNVTVSATAGELTPTTAALENGIAHVQYALTAEQGPATVTADVSGIKVSKEIEGISDKVNREVSISTETITVAYPASGSITITASAPGTYVVHVGSNVYDAVIETAGGSATVTVPKLPVGSYDVSVTAPETEDYYAVNTGKIATYTVNPGTVTVTSADVTVTYPNTNSVTITASAAGEYTLTVGDKTYPAVITEDGGSASILIDQLAVGDYGISVSGNAGDNYSPIDTGIINYYHVLAGSINVSGQGTTVTYPDKGTIVITTDVAGTYTIKVGDKTYENVELNAGANDFNVPDELNADDYDIKVSASIPNYEAITDKSIATYTVNKADSSVSVDPISFAYGAVGTGIATLSGATGFTATIEGFENAVSVNGNVITVSGLPANANAYTMVVTTVPDANHNAVSINVAVTVNKADATVTLTADKTEILFGQSATLDAVVSPEGATGAVTYYVNDEPITGNVLSGVAVGTYTVVAKYAGNENYKPADSNVVTITVDQVAPIVSVSADPVKYGVNGDVVVTVTGIDGVPLQGITVKVKVDGKEYSDITADNGVVHLLIDILPVSEYTITVDTVASGNYGAGHNYDKSLEVIKGDLTITAATSASSVDYGNAIVFTYDIDNPAGTTTAGKISYIVDGAPIDSSSISTLAAGPHTVVAKYTDDPNFNDAESEAVEFTVNPVASSVSVDPISFTYGGSATATASLTGAETVTATIEGFENAITVNGNVITVSGLPANANAYTMVVTTVPDANHIATSINVEVTVNKADATLTLTADKYEITFGETVTLTAVLSPSDATGLITYIVDGEEVESNVLTNLAAGNRIVSAKYAGDDNYNWAAGGPTTIHVNKADSSVSVDPISFAYGAVGTGIATLSGATGFTATIEGFENAVSVNGNVITVSGLPVGTYTMVVTTVPDDNHNAVSINVPVGVGKEDATVALSADKEVIDFGETVTLDAVVSPEDATGPITYYVNDVAVDSKVLSGLAVGTYTVHAMYGGDDNYNAAVSNRISITVNPVASTVSVDPISFTYGGSTTAEATLTGATGFTATIEGFENAVSVNGNVITVSGLPANANAYTMVVTTVPDANHTAVSINVAVTVAQAASSVTVSADKPVAAFGEDVALSSVVSPSDATGAVTYYLDGVAVEGNVLSGLSVGDHIVIAKYAGDGNYLASESQELTISVGKAASSVTVSADNETIAFGEDVTLSSVVSPAGATGAVTYYLDGVAVEGNVLSGLAAGTYTVVAKYAGDGNYAPSESDELTITVSKIDSSVSVDSISFTYGGSDSAEATLVGATGVNAAIAGHDGAVSVDGTTITVSGLPAGDYTMVVTTVPDANHNAVSAEVAVTVNKANPVLVISANVTEIKYPESIKLSGTLTPDDATGPIVYYLDGTPVDGDVLARIAPGVYTVTAKYGGDENYNEADSSNSLEITVAKGDVSIEVTAGSYTITYGEDLFISRILVPADASVAVTYIVDGVEVDYQLISGLSAGTHTIAAKASESVYYNGAISETKTVTVTKAAVDVTVTADSVTYPNVATVVVNSNVPGTYTIRVGNKDYAVVVGDTGSGSQVIDLLEPGTYEVILTADLGFNYDPVVQVPACSFTVAKATPIVEVNDTSAEWNTPVSIPVKVTDADGKPISGSVIVTVDWEVDGVTQVVELDENGEGTANFVIDQALGDLTVTAKFIGNDNYTAAQDTAVLAITNSTDANIEAAADPVTFGEDSFIDVVVTDGRGAVLDVAKVNVTIDGETKELDVVDGKVNIGKLPVGDTPVTVSYVDESHKLATADVTVTVNPASGVQLEAVADNYTFGAGGKLNITVTDVDGNKLNGTVGIEVDGELLDPAAVVTDGFVSIDLAGHAVGEHTVYVTFYNESYLPADIITHFNVTKASPTVTITPTKDAYDFGEDVVLDLTVKDGETGVTGTVVVTVDGVNYAVDVTSGTGQLTVKGLASGTYEATADFIATDDYDAASAAPANVVVNAPIPKPIPVVTIVASKESYDFGEDVVLDVTVKDGETGVTGTVVVTVDGVEYLVDVSGGSGQLTVKGLINGDYEASADFIANDEYDAASAAKPAKFTVDAPIPVIQVDIVVTAEPDQVIIKLIDENGNPVEGKAVVAIDGVSQEVNVTGGIATIPASAGYHNISVVYEGDDIHAGTAVMKDIVVVLPQKIGTIMTISRSKTLTYNSTLDNRSDYLIYATLTDEYGNPLANKQVSLAAHGGIYNMTTDSKGQVRFYVAHSVKGVCTQALSFLGDEKYDASFVATNVQIEAQTVKFAVAKKTYKASAKTKKLTATLKNSKGKALAGKKVVFTVNGKKYTATTNSKGVATVKVSITKKGSYKVTATFAGDKTYKKATKTNKLVIK